MIIRLYTAFNGYVFGAVSTFFAAGLHNKSTGGPPVLIPNTEVKPCSAEDTRPATARENRKMPTSDSEYSSFPEQSGRLFTRAARRVISAGFFFC